MHMMYRWRHFAGVLLLATTPFAAGAEGPLPDPVPPAVIGRPLDEIRPYRPSRPKSTKPKRATQAAAGKPVRAAAPAAIAPAAAPLAIAPAAAQPEPAAQHAPKQALDDRVNPNARVADNVGQGTRLGRKPLAPGAYLGGKAQAVVRKYYEAHPAPSREPSWKIGEPVPARAELTGVPDKVRAALPKVPPGHQYVQLDGEVVLLAVQSRVVVDGVSRSAR
jgi:Ni/Co efflux regulator RcnB